MELQTRNLLKDFSFSNSFFFERLLPEGRLCSGLCGNNGLSIFDNRLRKISAFRDWRMEHQGPVIVLLVGWKNKPVSEKDIFSKLSLFQKVNINGGLHGCTLRHGVTEVPLWMPYTPINPLSGNPHLATLIEGLWKHCQKMVTNIFSFSHNVFYPIKAKPKPLSDMQIIVCKCFQLRCISEKWIYIEKQ